MSQTQAQEYSSIRCCPRCGSGRLQRSRRRGALDQLFAVFGGEIRRCQACATRRAWFGVSSLPIGKTNAFPGALAMLASAFLVGLLCFWRSIP